MPAETRAEDASSLCADTLLASAVAQLVAGELVAFPTETVYGLGADAGNPAAVARIFARKGRPLDHPVIVHVASASALSHWALEIPPAAELLARAFWPGPLTLILRRANGVSDAVTGGQDTVGVRCPSHPLAQALLRACEQAGIHGLAAPSANRFGHVSPTTADHVRAEFGAELFILDGGPAEVGIESTIVDVTGAAPRILRPGMITEAQLTAVLGRSLECSAETSRPRVSGSLAAHYAPRTPLELVPAPELPGRLSELCGRSTRVVLLSCELPPAVAPSEVIWLPMPSLPEDYARVLYARLREADAAERDLVLVEAPPGDSAWEALRDRLGRAAVGSGSPAP
ncbi:MAG: threonylcarbamoyl-AMP synthase [Gammaproteobacteria bacterium]|nr:threonylcarbamoyl-AMP synthase [Gammaproteobacteria bacterium]